MADQDRAPQRGPVPFPRLPARYHPVARLGEGATGHVIQAHDRLLGEDVAIKIVRRNLALMNRFRARFAREVAMTARMAHPHVVPVLDAGVLDDGRPFVVLAWADAGNLRRVLSQGVELNLLLAWMEQVCAALSALHARGLVHQDLKPANVLLRDQRGGRPVAWVADLGIADEVFQLAQDARRVGGTPTYMAPEQLQGRPQEVGPWTDLYAVGVMLYEALAGTRPHAGADRASLLAARRRPPPPLRPRAGLRLPQELLDLVAALLDPIPQQRYDLAADVRRVLARARSRLAAPMPPEPGEPPEVSTRALRWNRVAPEPPPPMPPEPRGLGTSARRSLDLFAVRELPLVGRDAERERLWAHARAVIAERRPRVVLLVGGRGSGRTRLAESVALDLEEGGWMEWARLSWHDPPGLDDGYMGAARHLLAPWAETRLDLQGRLARMIARDRGLPLAAALPEAGALARWAGLLLPGERPPDAATGLRFLLEHARQRAWRGGFCLILEEPEYAEAEGDGLGIAQALLDGSLPPIPALVLVVVAQEALRGRRDIRRRIDDLLAFGAERLDVPPLDREATHRLVEEALLLDPELAAALAEAVRGRPLFVQLALRDWAARGLLVPRRDGRFGLAPGAELKRILPDRPDELVRRRIEAAIGCCEAPEAARAMLATTALAGEEPPVTILRYVGRDALEALLAVGILEERGGLVRFEHRAIREVALEQARAREDAHQLHLALADAWRAMGERFGLDVALPLGHHLLYARRPSEAVPQLVKAVHTLLEQGRPGPAARVAEQAVEAADGVPDPDSLRGLDRRLEARHLRALALLRVGRPAEAREVAEDGMALGGGHALGRARLQAIVARAALEEGRLEEARAGLEAARLALHRFQDTDGLAEVALGRARLAERDNRLPHAVRAYEEILHLRPREHREWALAMSGVVQALLLMGRAEEAEPLVAELQEAAEASGDTINLAQARVARGVSQLALGRHEEAAASFREAQGLAASAGDVRMVLNCLNSLGEVARHQGRLREARLLYGRYARMAHTREDPALEAIGLLNLALLDLQVGDSDAADLQARAAQAALARRPTRWIQALVAAVRAAAAARRGDREGFEAAWGAAIDNGLRRLRSGDLLVPLRTIRDAAAAHGWSRQARAAAELMEGLGGP